MPHNVISLDDVLDQKTCPYDANVAILAGIDPSGNVIQAAMTADGKFAVQGVLLEGDLEIGAVEIKDATSDTRTVVKTDGLNNALVVMFNTPNQIVNGSVNVTDSAPISILAANATRRHISIYNAGGQTAYLGASGVTNLNGWWLAAGSTLSIPEYRGDLYAITATGLSTVLKVISFVIA